MSAYECRLRGHVTGILEEALTLPLEKILAFVRADPELWSMWVKKTDGNPEPPPDAYK